MDTKFVLALRRFKEAPSDKMLEGVNAMFLTITEMNLEEIVAAKQTLDLFQETHPLRESEKIVIAAFYKAMTLRCRGIWLMGQPRPMSSNEAFWDYLFDTITRVFGSKTLDNI